MYNPARGSYNNRNTRGGRGGRSNFNGRQHSNQQRGLFADGIWHCDCTPRLPTEHFKVKKEGKNQGRWFHTCQQPDKGTKISGTGDRGSGTAKGCGFFLWDEDAKPREAAAVLSGKRSEPRRESVQEGWNAGRAKVSVEESGFGPGIQGGKGLFAGLQDGVSVRGRDDASTASPTPPPSYSSGLPGTHGAKRNVQDADLDDEFGLDGMDDSDLVSAVGLLEPQTPRKAQKTGVYATPATTVKRRLPWEEQPATPVATTTAAQGYFDTPSKPSAGPLQPSLEPGTPAAPPTPATAASPSPPTRYKDAFINPADIPNSLTSEVLAILSPPTLSIPQEVLTSVRSTVTRHDMKYQGVIKGRDISRLAIKAKDAKIAELQARIASLEAEREVERGLGRLRRWTAERQAE